MNNNDRLPAQDDSLNIQSFNTLSWVIGRTLHGWKRVLISTVVGGAIFATGALLTDNQYQAHSSIFCQSSKRGLPLSMKEGLDIGGLLSLSGGGDEPPNLVVALLNSNELALACVNKFNLDSVWEIKPKDRRWENSVKRWNLAFGFRQDEEKVLHLYFKDKNPALATKVLEFSIAWVDSAYVSMKKKQALENNHFIFSLLTERRRMLAIAEDSLVSFQRTNLIIDPEIEVSSDQKLQLMLQEQLLSSKFQQEIARKASGESSSAFQQQSEKIRLIQNAIEKKVDNQLGSLKGKMKNSARIESWLTFARLKREVLIQNAVFQILLQQHEQAQFETQKSLPTFSVLDRVMTPTKKISPPRTIITLLGALLGFAAGAITTILSKEIKAFRSQLKISIREG
ncbi:MAG TPA: GNVR domain-containing protein [Fibrobacteria bacterium]|nr:GNVR domain-containing protein [Fibrobacteria bacterium]